MPRCMAEVLTQKAVVKTYRTKYENIVALDYICCTHYVPQVEYNCVHHELFWFFIMTRADTVHVIMVVGSDF